MSFNRVDRNLLVRVAQALREEAEVVKRSHQPWSADPESRSHKREYDRLLRDAGDLDALRHRMETAHPDMKRAKPAVLTTVGMPDG